MFAAGPGCPKLVKGSVRVAVFRSRNAPYQRCSGSKLVEMKHGDTASVGDPAGENEGDEDAEEGQCGDHVSML